MTAAVLPRRLALQRLLVVRRSTGEVQDGWFADLADWLRPTDVVVVNDAATLPASLPVTARGQALEFRLAGPVDEGWGVLFGPGTWRQPTEDRPPPPHLAVGETITVGRRASRVREVSSRHARLVRLDLSLDDVLRDGAPVQYSYVPRPLRLHEVQTPYAQRPWATEMPSAGRVLAPSMIDDLRSRGITVATVTHAAGLSSTGDRALDALLPLPERYEVPAGTWAAVSRAPRVIAVGTSVVRALESAARGRLAGVTELRIGPDTSLHVVDGLLSGMHEPGESHFQMMAAFTDLADLERAVQHAVDGGYRNHEFGDSTLLF